LRQGVYEVRLKPVDSPAEVRRYAYNVAPAEGDLNIISDQQLQTVLAGVPFEIHRAADFAAAESKPPGTNLGHHGLFFLLIVMFLIGDQVLGYFATYHPPLAQASR